MRASTLLTAVVALVSAACGSSRPTDWNAWAKERQKSFFRDQLEQSLATCDKGNPGACESAAIQYRSGRMSAAQDLDAADRLSKKACAGGDTRGCRSLWQSAENFREGIAVPRDHARALRLFREGCEEGRFGESCNSLGVMIAKGEGTAPNEAEAARWQREGCRLGAGIACRNLGERSSVGLGVEQSAGDAAEKLDRGCRHGDDEACGQLGMMYQQGRGVQRDDETASRLLRKGCGFNFRPEPICRALALQYAKGAGIEKDEETALDIFERTCKGESPESCVDAARAHEHGVGTKRDLREARSYYSLACGLGLRSSCKERERVTALYCKTSGDLTLCPGMR